MNKENRKLFVVGNAATFGSKNILEVKREELFSRFSFNYLKNIEKDYKNELDTTENKIKNCISNFENIAKEKLIELIPKQKIYKNNENYFSCFYLQCGKGGVLSGIWNLTDGLNLGLEYSQTDIPIFQSTIEICEFYKLNPYRLYSKGVYLFAIKDNLIDLFINEFKELNVKQIGSFTNEKQKIRTDISEHSFLTKEQQDEIDVIIPHWTKNN